MSGFIEAGFWRSILVLFIVFLGSFWLGEKIKAATKKAKAEYFVKFIPSIITLIYIWRIRHGIGWLITGIAVIAIMIHEIRTETDSFGYDKDGNFEGYVEQTNLIKYIEECITILEKAKTDSEGDDLKILEKINYGLDHLNALMRNIKRLGENDITHKKLKYYRELIDTEVQKATGQYEFKLGGVAGFVVGAIKAMRKNNG
jgi:hypothetical protein